MISILTRTFLFSLTRLSIVAIHGIGAHPVDTWCKKVGTGETSHYVNWLEKEDMLPSVVPNARIMRYGYMSRWYGDDAIRQKTTTVADRLLISLKRVRRVSRYIALLNSKY